MEIIQNQARYELKFEFELDECDRLNLRASMVSKNLIENGFHLPVHLCKQYEYLTTCPQNGWCS